MNGYMNQKNINFELKGKVREYLQFVFKQKDYNKNESEILNKLNKALKKEVIMEAYGKILMRTPKFFENFSNETLENLSSFMRPQTYSPEEFIYKVQLIFFLYLEAFF